VRVALHGEAAARLGGEAALLTLVGRVSPVPVPEPVAFDAATAALVLRRIEGRSLLDAPPARPRELVGQLAALLAALHAVSFDEAKQVVGPDPYPLADALDDARTSFDTVRHALDPQQVEVVEDFLRQAPPAEGPTTCLVHNDLGAEHILVAADGHTVTGVIDWSDAALADPARDIARLLRDLGPETAFEVLDRLPYGPEPGIRDRAVLLARCVLLEDLAYGLEHDARYSAAALAHLDRTFADP
jgi:aminoglycoside phosphotransferase (APT) family kinase protein